MADKMKYTSLKSLGFLVAEMNDTFLKKADVAEYSVTKLAEAESGFAASYQLTKDGTGIGDKINIPKDYLVKSGEVKVCTKADDPVAGYKKGDKYIDFVVNTAEGSGNESHIYLLVTELVDVYNGDNKGIVLGEGNIFSIKVDATNANGLEVGENGIKMNVVSESGAGAMTSAMLATLNSALQEEDLPEIPSITIGDATGSGNVISGLQMDPADDHKIIPVKGVVALTADDFEEITQAEIKALFNPTEATE